MKVLITLVILSLSLTSVEAGETTFYVTANRVNVRSNPSLKSEILYTVNWGRKFVGQKETDNWYSFIDKGLDRTLYISTTFAVEDSEFNRLAKGKLLSEDWQTLKRPRINVKISFPTFFKDTVITSRSGGGGGRIQNYSHDHQLKENDYFLEFYSSQSDSLDFEQFKRVCEDRPP